MSLNEIITELENIELESQEVYSASRLLLASVTYFKDRLQEREVWTSEDLEQLAVESMLNKAVDRLGAVLPDEEPDEKLPDDILEQ